MVKTSTGTEVWKQREWETVAKRVINGKPEERAFYTFENRRVSRVLNDLYFREKDGGLKKIKLLD